MATFIDITGQRFGRLTVIRREANNHGEARWLLRCDCGGETITTGTKIRSGYTTSCGCAQKAATSKAKFRHGESTGGGRQKQSRLHCIWSQMRSRCSNPNTIKWAIYGGRGIRVCEEWNDYVSFRDWALANGYADHLTLDRIDNDLGYSPANCRWATYSEQRINQRRMKS